MGRNEDRYMPIDEKWILWYVGGKVNGMIMVKNKQRYDKYGRESKRIASRVSKHDRNKDGMETFPI
jgi:hypothetical protein